MNIFTERLIKYLFILFVSILFFDFYSSIFKKKDNINLFKYASFVILHSAIIYFLSRIVFSSNSNFFIGIVALISAIFSLVLYKGDLKRKLLFILIFFMVLILCDIFIFNVFEIISDINIQDYILKENWLRVVLFTTSKLTLFFILKIICYFVVTNNIDIPMRYWLMIFSIFVISLIILMSIGEVGVVAVNFPNKQLHLIIGSVGISSISIFVYYIFIQMSTYYEKEQMYNIIKIKNEIIERNYLEREEYYLKTRKINHDFKNHIFCIASLLKSNQIKEAEEYIESINIIINSQPAIIKSGNSAADAILNLKLTEAQKNNIKMNIDAIIPMEIKIEPIHLCAVLSNIIDNAIEASIKINDESQRMIKVKINPYKNYLIISVKNKTDSNPLVAYKRFRTTKADKKKSWAGYKDN